MTAGMEDSASTRPARPAWAGRVARLALGLLLITLVAWATAALYFDCRIAWLRLPLAVGFPLAILGLALGVRRRWAALGLAFGAWAVVLAWWLSLAPSNQRDWRPDVAVLPRAEIDGDRITLHNVRYCRYRTETDYDVRHEDRTYDLRRLRSVDLFLVYWGSPWIGHTMVSFGFDDGQYLCVSIETRMERGEAYSALRGFFRQFELTYVIADERDVVRLRTNFRQGEEVHLYRLVGRPDKARQFLLDYLRHANALSEAPEWYNAATSNCTTNIRVHSEAAAEREHPFDWRILFNGRIDELLAQHHAFASPLPAAALKQAGHINARARAAGDAADFSRRIREGIPGIAP